MPAGEGSGDYGSSPVFWDDLINTQSGVKITISFIDFTVRRSRWSKFGYLAVFIQYKNHGKVMFY